MSLASLKSTTDTPKPLASLDEQWTGKMEEPAELAITYEYTTRSAPLLVDFQGSTKESALHKNGYTLLETVDEDGITLNRFLTTERFWNNEVRRAAMETGLEHFVPKILFLLRPETAITSCLHFLAKELGGMTDFEHQRDFIFNNPGLMSLTEPFWKKVLENYWSAGFSPGIVTKDRYLLFLALIESFHLSSVDGSKPGEASIPCPHVPLELLHDAGIYLPSVEFKDFIPTKDGYALIDKSQDRKNLPGVPTDLGFYNICYTCETPFAQEEEWSGHHCAAARTVECTGCGLSFSTASEYQVHALTFCKQGPLSRSRCPCCNTPGPKCWCQTHWQRTYALAASLMDGTYHAGSWLAIDPKAAPILIDASTYLSTHFVSTEEGKGDGSARSLPCPGPMSLKESLWVLDDTIIPQSREKDGIRYPMEPSGEHQGITWTSIKAQLESTLGAQIDYGQLPLPSPKAVPSSTQKASRDAAMRKYRDNYLGTSGINVDNAGEEELEILTNKINNIAEKLMDKQQSKFLLFALKKNEKEMKEEIVELTELRSAIAAKLQMSRDTFKRRLDFGLGHKDAEDHDGDSTADDDVGEDDDGSEKGTKKKSSREPPVDPKPRHTCNNESHLTETPPYRVFITLAAKTAHLSRSHHCPHRKNSPSCPFFYEFEEDLGKHLLARHPTPDLDDRCHLCDALVTAEHMDRHMESIHSQCTTCMVWYINLEDLKHHWDHDGGACRTPAASATAAPKRPPKVEPPEALTLATLPNISTGHESFLTEALSIILDTAIPDDRKDDKARAKDLINNYSFHQRHQASITRNPWTSMSQNTPFLEQPSFSHPPGHRERPFDKALDAAEVTDLSPYTSNRFANFILCDTIHAKVCGFIKQYFLSESSAVYLFLNHLSPENRDTLRANYRRHPYDLSYFELTSTLQYSYFNLDLRVLRDGIGNLKRGHSEHPLVFHSRVYKLASLASVNFTEQQKATWVEEKLREVFYKSLDTNLRLDIDEIESRTGVTMSSSELLQTFICRANLKSNPMDLNDEGLMGVAKVKEEQPSPRRGKKVNVITSYGSLAVNAQGPPTREEPKGERKRHRAKTPKKKDKPQTPKIKAIQKKPELEPRALQPAPRSRPRSPLETIAPARAGPTQRSGAVPHQETDKQAAIEKTLQKLGLTTQLLETMGPFCWGCGAGLKNFSQEPYHARRYCRLPMYTGTPHNCTSNIKLFHSEKDCPRRRQRVQRVHMED